MSDRELLELAAKAAGIDVWRGAGFQSEILFRKTASNGDGKVTGIEWSPLTDDGDALRLAVKLGLAINITPQKIYASDGWIDGINEIMDTADPYAATRRAIVRAAAEIGRRMK